MIYILLSIFAFFYIFSSSKVLNSGDAGEFVVSGATLGVAHPSGYPLYVEILKLFSFLPVGNLSFRMVLVSVLFSVLSLCMVYLVVMKITSDRWSSLFSTVLLAVAYSFWGQSVVIKFYPLNLFLIFCMLYISVKVILEGYDRKHQFFISFLLGLTLSNHHTGFMMVVPLLFISIFYIKDFLKNLPVSVLFFLSGFFVNLHMFLRGQKGFAVESVFDIKSFAFVFLRKNYESGASTEIAKNVVSSIEGYWYALKNVFIILQNNFPFYVFPIFILGVLYSFKISKKLGVFLLSFFITYSILFAKLVFSGYSMNMDAWYMGAHQYFLPMLAGFAVFSGLGFFWLLKALRKTSMELLKVVIPVAAILFISFSVFERLIDQNFNENYVPHTVTKTILSSMPIGSVYLTFGDNHTFQSWYFKYIAKYRDDICSQDYFSPESTKLITRGCQPVEIYKNSYFFSDFFKGEFTNISTQKRLYSIIYLQKNNPLRESLKNQFWVFSYMLLPVNLNIPEDYLNKKIVNWQELEYFSMLDCTQYFSDDQFTRLLCNYSLPFFAYLAKSIEVKNPTGKLEYNIKKENEKFIIKTGLENREILDLYSKVLENNKAEKFKYYPYTKEYMEKRR